MANGTDDYAEQWAQFLSSGPYHFSKWLLRPATALIVSPDLMKIAVIDDYKDDSAFEYNEQGRVVSVDLRFLMWSGGGISVSFNCPACECFHAISLVDRWNQQDWGTTLIHKICIDEGRTSFECVCGVMFIMWDSRKSLEFPYDLRELAPLYQIGMPPDRDLLLRYVLGPDSRSLVEDLCVISRMPYEGSLTDDPFRKFYWTNPPSFMSESNCIDSRKSGKHVHSGVRDVRIWRRRIYVLGCDRFAELTGNPYEGGYERVDRYIKNKYALSAYIAPDELLSSRALLESLVGPNEYQLFHLAEAQTNNSLPSGRPVVFEPTEQQIQDFVPQYREAKYTLDEKLRMRNLRQFGRYDQTGRLNILKQAYPDAPEDLLRKMMYQNKASRAALHYAFWKINGPVGAWEATQLYELLKVSKKRQSEDFSD